LTYQAYVESIVPHRFKYFDHDHEEKK